MCGYYDPAFVDPRPQPRAQAQDRQSLRPRPPSRSRHPPPPPGRAARSTPSGGDSSWWIKLLTVLVIGALLLYYYPLWMPQAQKLISPENIKPRSYRETPKSAEFEFTRHYNVDISGGNINYEFTAYYPPDLGENGDIQKVHSVDINPPPNNAYTPGGELYWQGITSSSFTISLKYHATVNMCNWDINAADSGTINDVPQDIKDRYLGPEWALITVDTDGDGLADAPQDNNGDGIPDVYRIDPNNAQIKSLADKIVGNDTNVYSILHKIYVYMTETGGFTYLTGRSGLPKVCTETLSDRTGDCDDQSILFASLARAKGVPAWLELGWLYSPKDRTWGGHGWLNVYIPLADGTHVVATIDVVNDLFLFRDANRLTEWIDDGYKGHWSGSTWVRSHIDEYYFSFAYTAVGNVNVHTQERFVSDYYNPTGTVRIYQDGTVNDGSEPLKYTPSTGALAVIISTFAALGAVWVVRRKRLA